MAKTTARKIKANGHWLYHKACDPSAYFGFTYCIVNRVTGKRYIGKKQYYSYSRGKRVKEMEWRTYTGSSKYLAGDLKLYGVEHFEFNILKEWKTRGWLAYAECNVQHKEDVLTAQLPNGDRAYYNAQILATRHIPNPKYHPEECKGT